MGDVIGGALLGLLFVGAVLVWFLGVYGGITATARNTLRTAVATERLVALAEWAIQNAQRKDGG